MWHGWTHTWNLKFLRICRLSTFDSTPFTCHYRHRFYQMTSPPYNKQIHNDIYGVPSVFVIVSENSKLIPNIRPKFQGCVVSRSLFLWLEFRHYFSITSRVRVIFPNLTVLSIYINICVTIGPFIWLYLWVIVSRVYGL